MVMNLGKGQPNLTDIEIGTPGKMIYRQNIRPRHGISLEHRIAIDAVVDGVVSTTPLGGRT